MWGAGGNGSGACSCNRCHHYMGTGGGYYNTKTIDTAEGCTYSVCAAGVYRCYSRDCTGCEGCASYVNGYNLSNFCAIGGRRGESQTSWATYCHSQWCCCMNPGNNGGDGYGLGALLIMAGREVKIYKVEDPIKEINLQQYCQMCEIAAKNTGNCNIGLHFGQKFLPKQL